MTVSALGFEQRPSYWFTWHSSRIRPGARVLDVACGVGRHAIAAAQLGASVIAIDRDRAKLAQGKQDATRQRLAIEWIESDLEQAWPDVGAFDVVLVFNYLDRPRMPRIIDAVKVGGLLMMESFLEIQRQLGWGPQSEAHLLQFGEIAKLVAPLTVVHGREAFEPADNTQWAAVASVLAQRTK